MVQITCNWIAKPSGTRISLVLKWILSRVISMMLDHTVDGAPSVQATGCEDQLRPKISKANAQMGQG